jgi:hypothetical protein
MALMKRYIVLLFSVLLASNALAQATREEIQEALQRATTASLFAVKGQMCNWDNAGIDWKDLRLYSVAFALTTSDVGKKLNQQQTNAIAARVTEPAALDRQRSVVEKAVANGVCRDETVPTNEKLWLETVKLVKAIQGNSSGVSQSTDASK